MTLQGKAMKQAATDFGNGQTLPFTPCKKGYIPMISGKRMVACPLHNRARSKRLAKEGGKFRVGEVDLETMFWLRLEEGQKSDVDTKVIANESSKIIDVQGKIESSSCDGQEKTSTRKSKAMVIPTR